MPLFLGLWISAVVWAAPIKKQAPSTISVMADIELLNGHVMHPSVELAEGKWGTIDMGDVGVKVRAHKDGKKLVRMEYQLFLQNGASHKDWKMAKATVPWSKTLEAKVPTADKVNRVRRLTLTPTLIQSAQ